MHPKLHVRFGGRAGETHQLKSRRGAPVRPYTYIPTTAGFLYLAAVIDVWSRRVVGWSMRNDLTTPLVTDTLDMAIATRRPDRVIHHSDRGSQHRNDEPAAGRDRPYLVAVPRVLAPKRRAPDRFVSCSTPASRR